MKPKSHLFAVVALGVLTAAVWRKPVVLPSSSTRSPSRLVDALAIDEPAAESGARTRSIRPTARSNNPSTFPEQHRGRAVEPAITFPTTTWPSSPRKARTHSARWLPCSPRSCRA